MTTITEYICMSCNGYSTNLDDDGDAILQNITSFTNFSIENINLKRKIESIFYFTILGSIITQSNGAKNDIRSNHVFQFDFAGNIL